MGGEGTPGGGLATRGRGGSGRGSGHAGSPWAPSSPPPPWVSSSTMKVGKGSGTPGGRGSKELLQAGGRRRTPASSRGRAGTNVLPRACWVPLPVPPTWPSRSPLTFPPANPPRATPSRWKAPESQNCSMKVTPRAPDLSLACRSVG